MKITRNTTESEVSKYAMHKTRRCDTTFYWSWDADGIGTTLKYASFVDGNAISSGGEIMANKKHQFARQFEWALTNRQASDLYSKITAH